MIRKSADQILLVIAALVMAISLYQLYFRPYERSALSAPTPLARLLNPKEIVKFKEGQSFAWKDARQGLEVADGDRLYTHKDSGVEVDFFEGPLLALAPNTLMQIRRAETGLGLELASGSFSTTFNKDTDYITLVLGKRRFVLSAKGKKAKVKIKKSETSAEITVLSGRVKLEEVKKKRTNQEVTQNRNESTQVPAANAVELAAGKTYTQNIDAPAAKITEEDSSLPPPTPLTVDKENSQNILYTPETLWPISWTPTKSEEDLPNEQRRKYEVEWIQNGITYKNTVEQEKMDLKLKSEGLGLQRVKWRVRQLIENKKSPWSPWQDLSFNQEKPLEQFPETGSEITLEKPNQEVSFSWQSEIKSNENSQYLFEVARDPSFSKNRFSEKTKASELKIPLGAAGTYYWRVKIVDEKGRVRLGRPVEIKVRPAPPPAPIKLKEKLKFKIKRKANKTSLLIKSPILKIVTYLIQSTYAQNKEGAEGITLTWPKERLAKSYIIKIYDGEGDSSPLIEEEVKTNSFRWTNPKAGDFYWEVIIRDYWDRLGEPSNRSLVQIEVEKVTPKKMTKKVTKKIKKKLKKAKKKTAKRKPKAKKRSKKKITGDLKIAKPTEKKSFFKELSFFQVLSQSTVESTSTRFLAEADGTVIQSLGGLASFNAFGTTPVELGLIAGKGKAFEVLDYWQTNFWATIGFRPSFLGSWSFHTGPEIYYQTYFIEKTRGTISESQEMLFSGRLSLKKNFSFLGLDHHFEAKGSFGQVTAFGFALKTEVFKWSEKPIFLGLNYESITFESEEANLLTETTRNSLGVLWQVTWP